ncbi:MAG: hypothetical protein ACFFDT_32855, partial [Candidatus Hodarchaeota archaeon]
MKEWMRKGIMFGWQAKIRNLIADSCPKLLTKLKEHLLGLTVIMVLAIMVSRNLLFSSDFPAGTDALGWISSISTLTENRAMFYLWRYFSFGEVNVFTLRLPLSILNLFLQNSLFVVKIFIYVTFVFSGVSMYFFTYYYTKRKIAGLFSSIVFMVNQWYISQWASGHLNHIFAYAMLPLVFFSFDRSLKSGKIKPTIIFSAGLTLILLCRFDPFAYSIPFLILYAISVATIPYDGIGRKIVLIHILKVVLMGGAFVFLFFAFQFVPILSGVRAGYISLETSFPIEEFKEYSFGLFESMLGLARESGNLGWKGGIWWDTHPFLALTQYRMVMSILVILAFSAILLRRNRLTLFFIFSALISAFLAKGPHPPFGEIFLWLY